MSNASNVIRCMFARSLTISLAAVLFAVVPAHPAAAQGTARDTAESDVGRLRAELHRSYPSLAYVERYRRAFPAEVQGSDALWRAGAPLPLISSNGDLVRALVGLQDQHVSLAGPNAGGSQTLGVLFRTSSDGHMIVWRVFEPSVAGVREGDVVQAVDGTPTAAWLERAAVTTFGGNRRSRAAEAAQRLGLGTTVVHQTAGLGRSVTLTIRSGTAVARRVTLPWLPMTASRGAAVAAALDRADLPRTLEVDGRRVGTLRLGGFAPQFDSAFTAAADEAEKRPGVTEEEAMIAGFCAVVRRFIAEGDALASASDVLLLDLRGNFGGFQREARLFAEALAPAPLPASFDVFATGRAGTLRLEPLPDDPSCGRLARARPLVVLTDAGTRSSGEFMAAWLWGAGATVAGERTLGGGGGLDSQAQGFELPQLGLRVKMSGAFTVFDVTQALSAGETAEAPLLDQVAREGFAPSRTRPFAIQAAGLRPDLEEPTTLADLRDGGVSLATRIVRRIRTQGGLP